MKELVRKVIAEAELSNSSIHGVGHWRMVERNAHYLCRFNEADLEVVCLFAPVVYYGSRGYCWAR